MFFFFFNEHVDELRKAAESAKAKAIIESEEYYFQKALINTRNIRSCM